MSLFFVILVVVVVVLAALVFYYSALYAEAETYIGLVLDGTIRESEHELSHVRCSACATKGDLGEGARGALKALRFWIEIEEARFGGSKMRGTCEAAVLYWQELLHDVEQSARESFPELFEEERLGLWDMQGILFFNLIEHFMELRLERVERILTSLDHTGFTAP